jgi:hypothetical protein
MPGIWLIATSSHGANANKYKDGETLAKSTMIYFCRHIVIILLSLFAMLLVPAGSLRAEDLEMVNRPINMKGFTGLLYTTAPYTLAPGVMEAGLASIYEDSAIPAYTLNEYPVVLAAGIGHDMEVAVKMSLFRQQTGTSSSQKSRGSGNAEVSYKWNFRPQQEYSIAPAVAILFTAIFPSNDSQSEFIQAKNWGAQVGVSAGSEISWDEHLLGIYADAEVTVRDLSNNKYRDRYGSVNAGILMPISKQRNLQLFLEYGFVSGKDVVNIYGLDYSAITYGLRMVSKRVNLTIGSQFEHKDRSGYGNSGKVIGMASIKF